MNTENISQVNIPKAEVNELLFSHEGTIDVMGKIIEQIKRSQMVPVGTAVENYDHDPKKRLIVIHPFSQVDEWNEFLLHSKYNMLVNHSNDMTLRVRDDVAIAKSKGIVLDPEPKFKTFILPLGPVFHLKFQAHLRAKGLLADFDAGYAMLRSKFADAPVLMHGSNVGKSQPIEFEQIAHVADVMPDAVVDVDAIADDISRDFAATQANG